MSTYINRFKAYQNKKKVCGEKEDWMSFKIKKITFLDLRRSQNKTKNHFILEEKNTLKDAKFKSI